FSTPIDEMPIFIKAGTTLPEYPVMQYVTEKLIDELSINIYHTTTDSESLIYEDHGESFAFEQQVYLEKKFRVKGTGSSLEINQETEGLYTESYQFYNLKIIGLPFELKHVSADNETLSFEKDASGNYLIKTDKRFKVIMLN